MRGGIQHILRDAFRGPRNKRTPLRENLPCPNTAEERGHLYGATIIANGPGRIKCAWFLVSGGSLLSVCNTEGQWTYHLGIAVIGCHDDGLASLTRTAKRRRLECVVAHDWTSPLSESSGNPRITAASARTRPSPSTRACKRRSARVPWSVWLEHLSLTRRRDWLQAIGAW